MKRRFRIFLLILALSAIITIFFKLKLPTHTILWREIHNAGHAPLFGILSLTVLGLSFLIFNDSLAPRHKHYLLAFLLTVTIGALTEFIQIFGSGDADIFDLLRDAIGAASFLGVAMVFDKEVGFVANRLKGRHRLAIGLISILLFLSAFVPVALWTRAYIERNVAFPSLANFGSYWGRKFINTWDCDFKKVSGPAADGQEGKVVGRFDLHKADYPGFKITEPVPDWTAYNRLVIDLECTSGTPVKLAVRIEDRAYNRNYGDRFNYSQMIPNGPSQIVLPFEIIRFAPETREMDMQKIDAIYIFAVKPDSATTLDFKNIYLE